MSYSDIINIVSNSASRIFNEKIDGQKLHDSTKSANVIPVNSMTPNNIANRQTLTKMYKLKILQSNCRGLNNIINDIILFLAENNIT